MTGSETARKSGRIRGRRTWGTPRYGRLVTDDVRFAFQKEDFEGPRLPQLIPPQSVQRVRYGTVHHLSGDIQYFPPPPRPPFAIPHQLSHRTSFRPAVDRILAPTHYGNASWETHALVERTSGLRARHHPLTTPARPLRTRRPRSRIARCRHPKPSPTCRAARTRRTRVLRDACAGRTGSYRLGS